MSAEPSGGLDRLRRVLEVRPITLRVPQVYCDVDAGNPWGAFADDIAALLASGGLDREAVARIVDPEAFCAAFVACAHFHARREMALAKADLILALANSPPPHPNATSDPST